jgi:hypothetical protein
MVWSDAPRHCSKRGAARSAFSALVVAGAAAIVALIACSDTTPSNSRHDGGTDDDGGTEPPRPPEEKDSGSQGSHPQTEPVACGAPRSPIDAPDGSASTALVLDPCCPFRQVLVLVPVVFQGVPRTSSGEVVTARGCCLPTGQCGGALVDVWRYDPETQFVNHEYTSPDHCSPYEPTTAIDGLIVWNDEPPMQSCQYPFRLPGDAATSSVDAVADASVHDASSDRWGDSGDR